jgi:hypothetical protein
MADDARSIVLLPRFTSLAGPASGSMDVFTDPVNVRDFGSVEVTGYGGGTVTLQESQDLATWTDKGSVTMTGTQPVTSFTTLDTEWVRLKFALGTGVRLTCWVVGQFTLRGP